MRMRPSTPIFLVSRRMTLARRVSGSVSGLGRGAACVAGSVARLTMVRAVTLARRAPKRHAGGDGVRSAPEHVAAVTSAGFLLPGCLLPGGAERDAARRHRR